MDSFNIFVQTDTTYFHNLLKYIDPKYTYVVVRNLGNGNYYFICFEETQQLAEQRVITETNAYYDFVFECKSIDSL